jgi:nitrite reductase (NADH) small subunit/3-phenylpropionate/trans-cinnamate dioxygenase ferredoxin subunit
MPDFVTLAKASEIAPGTLKHVEMDSGTQVCIANVGGTFYAIGGECTHMGGPLGEGDLDGAIVTCPWHSGQFDVTTGKMVGPPPEEDEPAYEVRVEGDEVQVAVE